MSSRVPAAFASAVGGRGTIVIRFAQPADDAALARLENLSARTLPATHVLVAEADGEVIAAAPADGRGDALADPFRVTLDVVELLRLRARQLRAAA